MELFDKIILLVSAFSFSTAIFHECNHNLVTPEGTIVTPNYPKNYPPDFQCVWIITAAKGYYVELTFIDFDVEPYDDCKTDVLEIKDGGNEDAPLIGGQYCNQRRPPKTITSTHNELRLWFQSDSTIEKKGFKATYKRIKDEGCGGEITAEHGEIVTPRFPLHYPRDRKCEWKIKVPQGKFVALKFLFFEIETTCPSGGSCKCLDSVSIKDGHSKDAKLLGIYCFGAPPPIVTSGNELSIKFNSDLYGRLQGFKAIFSQSSTERCGGDLAIKNGTIESPYFNPAGLTTYPSYSECVWTIIAEKTEYISVRFNYMDVPMSANGVCSNDYVEIRDGDTAVSPLIGKYCNMFVPDALVSSGDRMYIRFHSDAEENRKGFQLTFLTHKKSCTSSLGVEDGRIPKGALTVSSTFRIAHEPYELGADYGRLNGALAWCSQEHKSSLNGEYFQIKFKNFIKITKIATQGYTMYGNFYYVTKYKMQYSTGTALQHYANEKDTDRGVLYTLFDGNRNYNVTKENELSPAIAAKTIRIEPLDYHSGKRKHVCMRVEIYGCKVDTGDSGKVLTKPSDVIEYSSYKKSTSTWVISPEVSNKNSVYLFHVKKLHAECSTSKLQISSGENSISDKMIYCDNTGKPETLIRYTSQQLWIHFDIMSLPSSFQGFKFVYKTQDLGLGRLITSQHGVINGIHSVLSTTTKPSVWLFKLPIGNRFKLEFSSIRLPRRKEGSFLLIKSGLSETSHVIQKIVGFKDPMAFVHPKNELRIEYHPGHLENKNSRHRREGFTIKYSTWNDGIKHKEKHRIAQ